MQDNRLRCPVSLCLHSLFARLQTQDYNARQRKQKQAKLSRDFQSAVLSFQSAAKASIEKQRQNVERARAAIDNNESPFDQNTGAPATAAMGGGQQQQQLQTQRQSDLIPDSELEYQEQVIQEREGEIREIEAGVVELNEIFRDLGTIVTEQQSMLGTWQLASIKAQCQRNLAKLLSIRR